MKRHSRNAIILTLGLVAGAFAAEPSRTREVKAGAIHRAAMDKLSRQGSELDEAAKILNARYDAHRAETAAIMSDMRAAFGLVEGEDFTAYDPQKGVFTVTIKPAPAPSVTIPEAK